MIIFRFVDMAAWSGACGMFRVVGAVRQPTNRYVFELENFFMLEYMDSRNLC